MLQLVSIIPNSISNRHYNIQPNLLKPNTEEQISIFENNLIL